MTEHVAIEYVDDVPIAIYRITMPHFAARNATAQIRSFEAFRKRMQENVFRFCCPKGDPKNGVRAAFIPGQRFRVQWAEEFEIDMDSWWRTFKDAPEDNPFRDLPEYFFNDVYEFFKRIGYEFRFRRLKSWRTDVRRDRRRRVV